MGSRRPPGYVTGGLLLWGGGAQRNPIGGPRLRVVGEEVPARVLVWHTHHPRGLLPNGGVGSGVTPTARGERMSDTVLSYDAADDPVEPVIDPETHQPAEGQPHFVVDNDRKATWAMRKLLDHRTEIDGIVAVAEAEIARIQQWADEQVAKHAPSIAYFEAQLTRYAASVREESGGKVKSVSTPYGKVTSRAGTDKWVIDDEAFLDWARESYPSWIRTVEQRNVDVATLKANLSVESTDTLGLVAMTEDGEIIPGISIVPGETSFKVEVAK